MFKNRKDAGAQLSIALDFLRGQDAVILAIPRGGVVVAAQVAKELGLPLDLIIPRKIGAPGNLELAIGAVAGSGEPYLKRDLIRMLGVSEDYIQKETKRQVAEIKRREEIYLQKKSRVKIEGKTVVIVDDGIATGSTAIAAVRTVRQQNPAKVILAVPVASPEGKKALEAEADEVIVLEAPESFMAVGQFYEEFEQTSDEEVKDLLSQI